METPITAVHTPAPERAAPYDAVPVTPPRYVTYLLWPLLRAARRFRAWGEAIDLWIKLALCQWLGITQTFGFERRLIEGLRHDLDKTAGVVGQIIPQLNRNTEHIGELQTVHRPALLRFRKSHPDRKVFALPVPETPANEQP